jgi:hypothetical protein
MNIVTMLKHSMGFMKQSTLVLAAGMLVQSAAQAALVSETTTSGSATIISFTGGSGIWTVPEGVSSVKLLVVAGGGGGGGIDTAGGGGAGGLIHYGPELGAAGVSYAVTAGNNYTVIVGTGGAAGYYDGGNKVEALKGGDSKFDTAVAVGGGFGGTRWGGGGVGGSGGGASIGPWYELDGATASPVGQGNAGGRSSVVDTGSWDNFSGGGGGGAGGAGFAGVWTVAGNGGAGYTWSVTGVTYAGGGGGSTFGPPRVGLTQGSGGTGGGGAAFVAGTDGLGGGGGANAKGGSGIVIVSYTLGAPLSVSISSPTNNQAFFTTASVSATALAEGGTPVYTVTYYTNYNGGAFAPAGSTNVALSAVELGTLVAGTYGIYATVTDSASGSATSATNMFTVTVEAPTKLAITDVNGGGSPVAGAPYSVTVTAANPGGTPVNVLENTEVTLSLASGTAGSLGGTLTGTILTGNNSVTISGVTNTKVEAVTLQAATSSGASLTAATASYTIVPASAASLTVAGFPSPQSAGAAGSVTVTVKDAYNNLATNYTGTVTLTSSDGAAELPGSYTFTGADAGVKALFVTLKTIGTQSITAGDGSLTGTQSGISITAVPVISIFTIPGTSSWTAPSGVTAIELLVVAGGGGGGLGGGAGGGGAGGVIHYGAETNAVAISYSVTPGQTYTIIVGTGGGVKTNGQDSSFGSVTAVGGGGGGSFWGYVSNSADASGAVGGSGGGAGQWYFTGNATPGTGTAGQGFSGGESVEAGQLQAGGGGGGGAGGVGLDAYDTGNYGNGGNGGPGLTYSISGSAVAYAGGGGTFWGDPGNFDNHVQGVGGVGSSAPGGGGTASFYWTGNATTSTSTPGQNGIVIVKCLPPKGTLIILF